MTSTNTLGPSGTGEIAVSEPGMATQNLVPFLLHPPVRRPQVFRPADLGELQRLAVGETLILPLDAAPAPVRPASTVTYRPSHATPERYQGRRRKPPRWPWVALAAGSTLIIAASTAIAALVAFR